MATINLIGSGNVATHLERAFKDKAEIFVVNPHTFEGFNTNADFSIIAVSDNAIREVAAKIPDSESIIAHTSGSTPADILSFKGNKYGVFYPLQTFSKARDLNYKEIPFFIEACDDDTESRLLKLASLVSDNVSIADSEKRKALHVASVFACNFANHLWNIADQILKNNGLHFNMIQPLLKETLNKTKDLTPAQAQTGPAIRKDTNTMASHLDFLSDNIEWSELYRMISSCIISNSK